MYRFEDQRKHVTIAGRSYQAGDTIEGAALELAIRFGFKVVEIAAEAALKHAEQELPKMIEAAQDFNMLPMGELLKLARERGYSGTSKAKTKLIAFLEGGE